MTPLPVFVTSNERKAAQLSRQLNLELRHESVDLPEIQSLSLADVVAQKAQAAFSELGVPVLVEDTSLVLHALGALPGPLVKWFLQELGSAGIARLLNGYPDRSATAAALYGYYDGHALHTFLSERHGKIVGDVRGELGFGFDPIFIPEGADCTWGEMTEEDRLAFSLRGPALRQLEQFLRGDQE